MKTLLLFLFLVSTLQAQHRFGWVGDDGRKKATPFNLRPGFSELKIREKSDLTALMPPIQDQGNLGSCVGNGVARVMDYASRLQTKKYFTPSRIFIYYGARRLEGTVNQDSGCQIVDGIKVTQIYGAPPEALWPYVIRDFAKRPPAPVYAEAEKRQSIKAYKIDNTDKTSIRRALSNGFPVVFGSLVYSGIERVTAKNPILPMPRRGERPIGGHAMTITGHDDTKRLYTVDNSWGTSYGQNGRLFIPYDYIHSGRLTEDCWIVEQIETPDSQ